MDVQEAIKKRRTIHSFKTTHVPEVIIKRAVEAANFAPCHRHTFPWRFTSLQSERRDSLAKLALSLKFEKITPDQISKERVLAKILNPSHLLIASQVLNGNPKSKLEDYAACSCAIQNLFLSLTAEGVGSKWSTGTITTHKKTYNIGGINPDEEEIIGFILIGYGEATNKVERPLLNSVLREY
tara:strand:- start:97 stop:645 length:549 start_codon:yes stop_codon:yes gene_type:complete